MERKISDLGVCFHLVLQRVLPSETGRNQQERPRNFKFRNYWKIFPTVGLVYFKFIVQV
jgi:hypothetical protein